MSYNVAKGERMATIALKGSELEVIFDSKYNAFNVKSDSDVTVALSPGKSKGDDGVMIARKDEPVFYPHMRSLNKVYITGEGEVTVFALNETVPVFKRGGKGGGDSVKSGVISLSGVYGKYTTGVAVENLTQEEL